MSNISIKLAAMLTDIAGDSEGFAKQIRKFSEEIEETDDSEIRKKVAHLLNTAEWTYLKAKYLTYFVTENCETEGIEPAIELKSSLTVYSGDYLVFELSPMANLRKRHERTGLGRVTFHEVLTLSSEYSRQFGKTSYVHPVVKFIHHVTEEDYRNGWIPDADNLDSSKALDALVTGLIIPDDSCLALDLIHEGVISERTYTEMHVYEKGKKKTKKPVKTITKFTPNGTRLNSYTFSPV